MTTQPYDLLYLSPHLDDVPFSCGGQIWQRTQANQRILIVTVTTADAPTEGLSPFAEEMHNAWAEPGNQVVARRRAEDIEACRILGADWLHLGWSDAIYRRDPMSGAHLYTDDATLFGRLPEAEHPLVLKLAERFAQLPPARTIIAPLARGCHVDHQLVRQAAEVAFAPHLRYYEDYPYVDWGWGEAEWSQERVQFEPLLEETSTFARQARLAASLAYHSQLPHLFESAEKLTTMLARYTERVGGERLYDKTPITFGEKIPTGIK